MGVRGLQTYIETQCPHACKTVSIHQLANDHRLKYNCQPVIVVDGMSLINRLYAKTLEWIYGGQWIQFKIQLEQFIALFHNIGVKLIFFFDGTVCAAKRKEWVSRRVNKYRQVAEIFSEIRSNPQEPDHKLFKLPTAFGSLARFALKELGAEVYQTDREADEVIAEYALKNFEVFAIFSQDSDFIIFNTKLYLSIQHLNLDSLTTVLYDRQYFASHYLHLNVNQLPLFACLAGNDIIPFDKLRQFHKYLLNFKYGKIFLSDIAYNLASLISKEHWTGNYNDKNELARISSAICGDPSLLHEICDGLKSYSLEFEDSLPDVCITLQPRTEKEVYRRHLQCLNSPYVFNLLCNLEYESSEVLEEDTSRLPSALVYRKIRQRCYAVMFNYVSSQYNLNTRTKDGKPILIKEWCAYAGNLMEKPEYINPLSLKLPRQMQGLSLNIESLWFCHTEVEKMAVFWSLLELPMEFELLLTVPKKFTVLTSVLNYLLGNAEKNPLLNPLDVAVFILQALWRKNAKELEQLPPPVVNPSAVNLATLFIRGVLSVLMVLNVCGNPFPVTFAMPWNFFDGKLFHFLYDKATNGKLIMEFWDQKNELRQEFHYLLQTVTKNTPYDVTRFNWNDILKQINV